MIIADNRGGEASISPQQLAALLRDPERHRTVVVMSTQHRGSDYSAVLADLEDAVGQSVDFVIVCSGPFTFQLQDELGGAAHVFGGAMRIYPPGDDWLTNTRTAPLLLPRTDDANRPEEIVRLVQGALANIGQSTARDTCLRSVAQLTNNQGVVWSGFATHVAEYHEHRMAGRRAYDLGGILLFEFERNRSLARIHEHYWTPIRELPYEEQVVLFDDLIEAVESITDPALPGDVVVRCTLIYEASKRALFEADVGRAEVLADHGLTTAKGAPTAIAMGLQALLACQKARIAMLSEGEARADDSARILADLDEAATCIERRTHVPSRLVHDYLRLSVARARYFDWRRRGDDAAGMQYREMSIAGLSLSARKACEWLGGTAAATGPIADVLVDLCSIAPPAQHQTIDRLITQLSAASAAAGREKNLRLSVLPSLRQLKVNERVRFEGLLSDAYTTPSLQVAVDLLAEATIIGRSGGLAVHREAVRRGLAKRYKSCAKKVAQDLFQAKRSISANFWLWEARRTSTLIRSASLPEPEVILEMEVVPEVARGEGEDFFTGSDLSITERESGLDIFDEQRTPGVPSLAPSRGHSVGELGESDLQLPKPRRRRTRSRRPGGAASNPRVPQPPLGELLEALEEALVRESPAALILHLRRLGRLLSVDLDHASVRSVLQRVDTWLEEAPRANSPVLVHVQDTGISIARKFLPNMLPAMLWGAARHTQTTPDRSHELLTAMEQACARQGRWREQSEALVALMSAAGDEDMGVLCERLMDVYKSAYFGATSLVDLVEALSMVHKQSGSVAALLCRAGNIGLAFEIEAMASGVMSAYVRDHPSGTEFYNALEEYSSSSGADGEPALFLLLEGELGSGPVKGRTTWGTSRIAKHGQTILVFGIGPKDECFAMWHRRGRVSDEDNHGFQRLEVRRSTLERLLRMIWSQPWLDVDTDEAVDEVEDFDPLAFLWRALFASLPVDVLDDVDEVLVHFANRFPTLPVHAALDGSSYLIERLAVRYVSVLAEVESASGMYEPGKGRALVCGWESSIGAWEERSMVAARLDQTGIAVVSPDNPRQGIELLQDRHLSFDLVHLAGHYQPEAWPSSSSSRIVLSEGDVLTAADWLRDAPYSRFCFLNACSTGPLATRIGDAAGLPMAIRARGASGSITTLSLVYAHDAAHFAREFYADVRDGLMAAYLRTVRMCIREGRHYISWAPYCFDGDDLVLNPDPAS